MTLPVNSNNSLFRQRLDKMVLDWISNSCIRICMQGIFGPNSTSNILILNDMQKRSLLYYLIPHRLLSRIFLCIQIIRRKISRSVSSV